MNRSRGSLTHRTRLGLIAAGILTALIGIVPTVAMAYPGELWVKKWFYPSRNDPEYAVDLGVDSRGNVIVTGYRTGYGTNTYTVKYRPDGSEEWSFAKYSSGQALALAIDSLDNVFVMTRRTGSVYDYGISRISSSGVVWSSAFSSSGEMADMPVALVPDSEGSVIVTGTSWANTPTGNRAAIATVKWNSSGVQEWVSLFDRADFGGNNFVSDVAVDPSDNVIVVGTLPGAWPQLSAFLVIKYAPDGSELWAKSYDFEEGCYDGAVAVEVDTSGDIYVAGSSTTVDYNSRYVTVKYDPDGTELWSRSYDGAPSGGDIPLAMELDPLGHVIVTGMSRKADSSGYYIDTVKYSSDGDEQWVNRNPIYELRSSGDFGDMAVDKDGNVLIVGRFENAYWGNDYFTTKVGSDGTYLWRMTSSDPDDATYHSDDGAAAVGTDQYGDIYVTGHAYGKGDNRVGDQKSQNYLTIKYSEHAAPVADAGPYSITVDEGAQDVLLDGSGSRNAVNYLWRQLSGPTVTLEPDNTVVQPTFDAPLVVTSVNLAFELTVDNGAGVTHSDRTNVYVKSLNTAPVSDAGDDSTIKEGNLMILDGSNSYDPEGDPLTYSWTQISGPTVTLVPSNTVVSPSFTAPGAGSELIFELEVYDGRLNSDPFDRVVITVVENSSPVADAGPDQTVMEGSEVFLDGSSSGDPDGSDTLSFSWTEPYPLDDYTSSTPSFTAPLVGPGGETLVFDLTVNDDDPFNPKADTDQVVITVQNLNDPPDCNLARPSCLESKIESNEGCLLWPPDHRMVPVGIVGVTDPNDDSVTIQIIGVTQDEPVNGDEDGDTAPDAVLADGGVLLRAERMGLIGTLEGNGRVYFVHFTADDGQGGVCSGSVAIGVPQGRKSTPINDGQVFNSLLP